MQARTPGKPSKKASALAARVEGMPRFSLEMPEALLAEVDRLAVADERSRNAEIRVLLGEAISARKKK